jgi:hypothetical protein
MYKTRNFSSLVIAVQYKKEIEYSLKIISRQKGNSKEAYSFSVLLSRRIQAGS